MKNRYDHEDKNEEKDSEESRKKVIETGDWFNDDLENVYGMNIIQKSYHR